MTHSQTEPASREENLSRAGQEPKPAREPGSARKQVKGAVDGARNRIGSVVWMFAVVCALILSAAGLLVALDANENNEIVMWVNERANQLNGPLGDLFTFDGKNRRQKALLVNNGVAAVAYLVVGKVAERLIKP